MTGNYKLEVWAEVVEDRRSWFSPFRLGRLFKTRPDGHQGRLIKVEMSVPRNFLQVEDVVVKLEVPADDPGTIEAGVEPQGDDR